MSVYVSVSIEEAKKPKYSVIIVNKFREQDEQLIKSAGLWKRYLQMVAELEMNPWTEEFSGHDLTKDLNGCRA